MRKGIRQTLNTRTSMARYHSSDGNGWNLRIEDEASSGSIIEIQLTDTELGQLLGASTVEVKAEYFANPNIGKRMEVATIFAPLEYEDFVGAGGTIDEEEIRLTCTMAMGRAGYRLNDGWRPEVPRSFNRHNLDRAKGYSVTIRRYVEIEPSEPELHSVFDAGMEV